MFRYISIIFFIFLVVIVTGFAAIDYMLFLYLLGGILIGSFLLNSKSNIIKNSLEILRVLPKQVLGLIFLMIVVLIAYTIFLSPRNSGLGGNAGLACKTGDVTTEITVTEYHAVVAPVNFSQGVFKVSEEAKYKIENFTCESDGSTTKTIVEEDKAVSIPERLVYSSKRGYIVREIHIIPLDGSPLKHKCCTNKGNVELTDFPRNSFYEGRNIENVSISPYLDTEIVQWNQYLKRDDIVFAYISNPFRFFRNLLSPLIGASYQSNWLIGLASVIVSFIIFPILKPVFEDFIKKKFKALIEKREISQDETKRSPLIISSKGDEKQIDISINPPSEARPLLPIILNLRKIIDWLSVSSHLTAKPFGIWKTLLVSTLIAGFAILVITLGLGMTWKSSELSRLIIITPLYSTVSLTYLLSKNKISIIICMLEIIVFTSLLVMDWDWDIAILLTVMAVLGILSFSNNTSSRIHFARTFFATGLSASAFIIFVSNAGAYSSSLEFSFDLIDVVSILSATFLSITMAKIFGRG